MSLIPVARTNQKEDRLITASLLLDYRCYAPTQGHIRGVCFNLLFLFPHSKAEPLKAYQLALSIHEQFGLGKDFFGENSSKLSF
jgi:hypothetical protein